MTAPVALDTSVAVPLLGSTHEHFDLVRDALGDRAAVLCGHAVAETFSVLTRLRGVNGRTPDEAARLIDSNFGRPALLGAAMMRRLPTLLAEARIAGGAVYDALVGLAARENDLVLLTRDGRASNVYDALGVTVEFVR